jgi:hypothetical protein
LSAEIEDQDAVRVDVGRGRLHAGGHHPIR